MEIVSFEVAKIIKEAGYPQDQEEYAYRSNGQTYIFENMFDHIPDYCCDAPTYLEVWLWLWKEKNIQIQPSQKIVYIWPNGILIDNISDVEDGIITAINYLVDNDLIK